jgi:hypothetical protein
MIESGQQMKGTLNIVLTVFVIACVGTLLLMAASRWITVLILSRSPSSRANEDSL